MRVHRILFRSCWRAKRCGSKSGGAALPVRQAVDCAMQIVRGLAAAYEKGIVHRDLKPENLFITKDGRVKILDFGLAKLTQPQPNSEHGAKRLKERTEPGLIMGTVGYMSPEQLRGQTVDYRGDIFAFGAILYEMLAGIRAFQKPTSADTMSAILNEEPPEISRVAGNVGPVLQRAVHRCPEKDPERRFQSAAELALALDAVSDSGHAYSTSAAQAWRHWKLISLASVAVLALSTGGYFYFHRPLKLTDNDTVVLSDFSNSTGDAIFDGTLKTALTVSLRQSPFLTMLPDSRVAKTLQLMSRPANTKLTPEVARGLCQRAGSKAYIAGSIGSLGNEYVLGLKAVNCRTGDTLAEELATATNKKKVLDVLGGVTAKMRGELGEALSTVQNFDVPLKQATTSSLEALKEFTTGISIRNEKDTAASLPYFQHAVELNPDFAMGYRSLAGVYITLGETALGRDYLQQGIPIAAARQRTRKDDRHR